MNKIKNIRKFRRNVKAISPIISTLLLIAIAVVASLVAYAWVMGYMGFQTAKTGQSIQVQSVSFNAGKITNVYVQNVGDGAVSLTQGQCLYVNGVLYKLTTMLPTGSVAAGSTVTLTTVGADQVAYPLGSVVTVKVTTQGGTYSQISQVVPDV